MLFEKNPGGQSSHVAFPGSSAYVPKVHEMHSVAPTCMPGAYDDEAQLWSSRFEHTIRAMTRTCISYLVCFVEKIITSVWGCGTFQYMLVRIAQRVISIYWIQYFCSTGCSNAGIFLTYSYTHRQTKQNKQSRNMYTCTHNGYYIFLPADRCGQCRMWTLHLVQTKTWATKK